MSRYPIDLYRGYSEAHFEYGTAANLARVTEEFICRCESEGLITCRIVLHGKKILYAGDVARLKMIRYLHENMGIGFDVVDFILRYHDHIVQMRKQLDSLERRLRREEREHLEKTISLERRLSKLQNSH